MIRLDFLPKTWEERLALYVGYQTDRGLQSSTLKSYISAIKAVLADDDYEWDDKKWKLTALTKSCRMTNDHVTTRLPIQVGLLEIIIHELRNFYESQLFLYVLYKCMFLLAYYGLLRVSELTNTKSNHAIKACDVHTNDDNTKLLIVMRSSKTHGKRDKPQELRINSNLIATARHFCPVQAINDYLQLKGDYIHEDEQLFTFSDHTPVRSSQFRWLLKKLLRNLGLNDKLYGTHSFRSGRATDLTKYGYSIDQVKLLGRWRSNAVFRYIRY